MALKRVSQQELAAALHVSDRTVRTLESSGVLPEPKEGLYDVQACLLAYVKHRAHDYEGRAARLESLAVQTLHHKMKMKKAMGALISAGELEDLALELWAGVWQVWGLCASHAYHALHAIPQRERLVLMGNLDNTAKAELHALREAFERRLRGERVALADEGRLERLMTELAAGDEASRD